MSDMLDVLSREAKIASCRHEWQNKILGVDHFRHCRLCGVWYHIQSRHITGSGIMVWIHGRVREGSPQAQKIQAWGGRL